MKLVTRASQDLAKATHGPILSNPELTGEKRVDKRGRLVTRYVKRGVTPRPVTPEPAPPPPLGADRGRRAAPPPAVKELEAPEAQAAREREIRTRIAAVTNRVIAAGEAPAGQHELDGERLLDTQDLYGGGDWFALEPDHIWYVRNNGADGDDWSKNNVITGGAGAMGVRVPRAPALERELRALDAGELPAPERAGDDGRYTCPDCGELVQIGTTCWETGTKH